MKKAPLRCRSGALTLSNSHTGTRPARESEVMDQASTDVAVLLHVSATACRDLAVHELTINPGALAQRVVKRSTEGRVLVLHTSGILSRLTTVADIQGHAADRNDDAKAPALIVRAGSADGALVVETVEFL